MRKLYQLTAYRVKLVVLLLVLSASLQTFSQVNLGFTDLVNTGLSAPVDIANDGSSRLFIVEQTGAIRIYDGGVALPTAFLDITSRISCCGERGLLSMAFHPQYSSNGLFYVYYTATNGDLTLERFVASPANANTVDPTTGRVMITIPHSTFSNHNGGHLAFGPDNNLYFATGDGGDGGDPSDNAQNNSVLLGKMLRISVTTDNVAPYYTVPGDNPFAGTPTSELIWHTGLRNPFRWSFDRANGNMWIGDVGQNLWEEVNMIPATTPGGITPPNINYGWDCFEGPNPFADLTQSIPCTGTYTVPIASYEHNNAEGGFAITGGYVYRGSAYPALQGYYIFADYLSANVWLLPPNGTAADTILYRALRDSVTSFGEDATGELFATTLNGRLFRVTASIIVTPVTLTSFTWAKKSNGFELTWDTKNEVNVEQYEIEASINGTDFRQVGKVKATNGGVYRFNHSTSDTKIFYRLKVMDVDGKFEYSKIIQASQSIVGTSNFVRPSVITNRVLELMLTESYDQVQIFNRQGREVWRQTLGGRIGSLRYPLPSLQPGNYLARILGPNKNATQKILIR